MLNLKHSKFSTRTTPGGIIPIGTMPGGGAWPMGTAIIGGLVLLVFAAATVLAPLDCCRAGGGVVMVMFICGGGGMGIGIGIGMTLFGFGLTLFGLPPPLFFSASFSLRSFEQRAFRSTSCSCISDTACCISDWLPVAAVSPPASAEGAAGSD